MPASVAETTVLEIQLVWERYLVIQHQILESEQIRKEDEIIWGIHLGPTGS